MFKKTIARLSFSPSLEDELNEYAGKLRREEIKRYIGLIFIALALIVQTFAALFPPESANAGRTDRYIESGINSINDYLAYYDQDTKNIKDLLTSLGISRSDLQATTLRTINTRDELVVWTMSDSGYNDTSRYGFLSDEGTTRTAYYQPLHSWRHDTSEMAAFTGLSSAGRFAILKSSGNLITTGNFSGPCSLKPEPVGDEPLALSLSSAAACGVGLSKTLSATNLTDQTSSASSRKALSGDRILYTLSIKNEYDRTIITTIGLGLTDILEYTILMDKGGGRFDETMKELSWPDITITPGSTLTRTFIVKLLAPLPSTATGQYNSHSYDCVMSATFGDSLHIPIACPVFKTLERTTRQLPSVSAGVNISLGVTSLLVATYFYIRARQLRIELRSIRHNLHGSL